MRNGAVSSDTPIFPRPLKATERGEFFHSLLRYPLSPPPMQRRLVLLLLIPSTETAEVQDFGPDFLVPLLPGAAYLFPLLSSS